MRQFPATTRSSTQFRDVKPRFLNKSIMPLERNGSLHLIITSNPILTYSTSPTLHANNVSTIRNINVDVFQWFYMFLIFLLSYVVWLMKVLGLIYFFMILLHKLLLVNSLHKFFVAKDAPNKWAVFNPQLLSPLGIGITCHFTCEILSYLALQDQNNLKHTLMILSRTL